MKVLNIEQVKNNKIIVIHVDNIKRVEGKLALNSLFDLLMETDEFTEFCENHICCSSI